MVSSKHILELKLDLKTKAVYISLIPLSLTVFDAWCIFTYGYRFLLLFYSYICKKFNHFLKLENDLSEIETLFVLITNELSDKKDNSKTINKL